METGLADGATNVMYLLQCLKVDRCLLWYIKLGLKQSVASAFQPYQLATLDFHV